MQVRQFGQGQDPTDPATRAVSDDSLQLFEVPLASEVSNLLNFLVLDVVLLPFIMYLSSKLAGYTNNGILQKLGTVTLEQFGIPLVGGGLVMPKGWRRILFVMLRLSVVVAVAVSNFGLEGRTGIAMVTRQGAVRVPGLLNDPNSTITDVALRQIRCNHRISDETVLHGSVVDGECYPKMTDFAIIRSRTYFPKIEASAMECKSFYNCDSDPYPTTTYRCDRADVVCNGVLPESGCSNAEGIKKNTFGELECYSLSYALGDDFVWYCNKDSVLPGTAMTLNDCWGFEVKREYVQWWNETFPRITFMLGKAMFASAYGAENRTEVTVPKGKRPVTGVRLRWVLSVAWVVAVALFFSVWVYFYVHQGLKETVHDEHGLVNLLQHRTGGMEGLSELGSRH